MAGPDSKGASAGVNLASAALAVVVIALLVGGNALLYFFVIIPFGQIYRIPVGIQHLIVGATTALSLGLFAYLSWKQTRNPKAEMDLGLGEEKPHIETSNPIREAEIALSDLDYNIRSKDYGKVASSYSQLQDALSKMPAKKRAAAKPRIDAMEKQIADLKEKGLI